MITVTETAKKQALRLMEDEGKDGYFIRVGVQGGGCSGLMYQLTFDNTEKEDDKTALKGIETYMKHHGMLTEKVEHSGDIDISVKWK